MGGAGAGLGPLVGSFLFLGALPLLLAIQIGWWVGKRLAYRHLTIRKICLATLILLVVALIFWYPSIFRLFNDSNRQAAPFFQINTFLAVLPWVFIPAGLAAAISWVLNVDDYFYLHRTKRAENLSDVGEPSE